MRVLLTVFLLIPMLSFSETEKKPAPKSLASTGKVKYKKVNLEFDGRSVDGNVVSPDNADIEGDKNIKFDSLLEGRKNFKREFKRSSGVTR
jgi:hypothetical protein